MAATPIPNRNPEWSSEAGAFTLRTVVSIVIASKFARIMRRTISSGNGVTVAAHRAITFLSDRYSSGKCVWARIFRTLGRVRQKKRKMRLRHRPEPQIVQPRPRRRAAHQRQALQRL